MPKQTFYNLSEEKQNKIIEACKREFSENPFYEASINKIIKDAGISRGSFYQYFDTKEDVFLYLLKQCAETIKKDIKREIQETELDIFEFFVLLFDVITEDKLEQSWKYFFETTISNMNIKLMFHLEKFIIEDNVKPPVNDMEAYVKWEKVQYEDETGQKAVCHLLVNTMIFLVGACLNDIEKKEFYRSALLSQFEMIKHGVLKE